MVPVTKKVIAGKTQEAEVPVKRRPRNQELNSSRSCDRIAAAVQARCQSLNSSKLYDGYPYEEISLDALAEQSRVSVPELKDIIDSLEKAKGCKVSKILVSDARDAEGEWDGKSIIVQTDCGDFYWGTEDFIPIESASGDSDLSELDSSEAPKESESLDDTESVNCSDASASSESGTVTLYNDFADLNPDEVEQLIKDRVKEMAPNCEVSIEKMNDTEMKVSLNGTDEEITRGRLAVESSDVTKSVDWENSLDSGCHGKEKLNNAESEGSVVTITTESGNEVAITDIKLVQNPDTNELALYVPENEDDEIPEGFAVVGTVISDTASTPAIEEDAETGDSDESDESLNSSRQETAPANREQRRHPNHRKLNSAKRRK